MPLLTGNPKVFVSAVQVGLATVTTANIAHGLGRIPDEAAVREVETSGTVGENSHLNVTFDATNVIVFNSGGSISGQYVVSAFIHTADPIG